MQRSLTMYRSAGQALFRYLPECIVEAAGGRAITKVSNWFGEPFQPDGAEKILEEIYDSYLGAYMRLDQRFPRSVPDVKKFKFYKPTFIELELFPLTFRNRRTGVCQEFVNIGDVKSFLRSETRNGAINNWEQMDLVYVNRNTGSVKSFHIIPCVQHRGNRFMVLDRQGRSSQRDWRWRCTVCSREYNVSGYVDNELISKADPVRSPEVFQPQIISVVNVRDYSKSKCGKDMAAEIIAAKYLELLDDSLENLFEEAAKLKKNGGKSDRGIDQVLEKMKKENYTAEQLEIVKKALLLHVNNSNGFESELKKVSDLLVGADMRRISFRLYEYLETLSEDTCMTLDQKMVEDKRSEAQLSLFKKRLEGVGVSKSYVLQKVPLMQVAYGYMRGSLDPAECMLRSFPQNQNDSSVIPLYANDIRTEALVLEFDRSKIGRWLSANSLIDKWDCPDEISEKVWFLKNVDTSLITKWEGVAEGSPNQKTMVTKHVFKLLHSISHALIKQIPHHAGISSDSLGEIIFPNIPAILIFSNSQGGFHLGELHELYENTIYPWIDNVKEANRNGGCVYDPVCFDSESACHYCQFLHEASCGHFNKELGRNYLFSNGTGSIKTGFWDFVKHEG